MHAPQYAEAVTQRSVLRILHKLDYLLGRDGVIVILQARVPPACRTTSQAVMMSETEEGKRLASLQAELVKLGVSSSLMNQAMGEKEDETTRRLEKAYDTQVCY